jgi:hypothetical protein
MPLRMNGLFGSWGRSARRRFNDGRQGIRGDLANGHEATASFHRWQLINAASELHPKDHGVGLQDLHVLARNASAGWGICEKSKCVL